MNRYATVAACLLFSTVCFIQTPSTAQTAEQAQYGVFQPAEKVPAAVRNEQPRSAVAVMQAPPAFGMGKEYKIGPNDLLEIEVLNLDTKVRNEANNNKRNVRVNAAGAVSLPLIGSVPIAGLTQQEAETRIAELYGEKYLQDPQISIFIKEFTTERITVDGAVSKPGIYPLVGQMTLLRALALAGGFGQIANRQEVVLFRQGEKGERQVAKFNVERISAGKDPDPVIRGDDLIVVQRDSSRALLKDSLLRDVIDSINPFSVFR